MRDRSWRWPHHAGRWAPFALAALVLFCLAGPASATPPRGRLIVATVDLPRAVHSAVVVRGPTGVRHLSSSARAVLRVRPGTYVISAVHVHGAGSTFGPVVGVQRVIVRAGHTMRVSVDYRNRLPDTTRAPPPAAIKSGSTNADGSGSFRLAKRSGTTGLAVGDVVVFGPGPTTPNGYVGRVTSVATTGGGVKLETSPATIFDAIPSGSFTVSIGPGGAAGSALGGNRTVQAIGGISRSFTHPLACGVSVGGSISAQPSATASFEWGGLLHPTDVDASFNGSIHETAELHASAPKGLSCNATEKIFPGDGLALGTIVVPVLGIPVTVTPTLQVSATATAQLGSPLDTSVHEDFTATAGVSYANGAFTHTSHLPTPTFGYGTPAPTLQGSLDAGIDSSLTFLIEDAAGPELLADARLTFAISPNALAPVPWWTLTGSINGGAGLTITKFIHTSYEDDHLVQFSKLLATGLHPSPLTPPPGSPGQPSQPTEPDTPAGPGTTTHTMPAGITAAVSPDGSIVAGTDVASPSTEAPAVWNARTGVMTDLAPPSASFTTGTDTNYAVSADGRYIGFTGYVSGSCMVWVAHSDGSDLIRANPDGLVADGCPLMSAGGDFALVQLADTLGLGRTGLYRLDLSDGSLVRLVDTEALLAAGRGIQNVALSPDGSNLLVQEVIANGGAVAGGEIYHANGASPTPVTLPGDLSYFSASGEINDIGAWSADGSHYVTFASADGSDFALVNLNIQTGNATRITPLDFDPMTPSVWDAPLIMTPDGLSVIYWAQEPGSGTAVWSSRIDGTDTHQVSPQTFGFSNVDPLVASGSTLFFIARDGSNYGLYRMGIGGANITLLFSSNDTAELEPAQFFVTGPSGGAQHIVFAGRDATAPPDLGYGPWSIGADGSDLTPLLPQATSATLPYFVLRGVAPDGSVVTGADGYGTFGSVAADEP